MGLLYLSRIRKYRIGLMKPYKTKFEINPEDAWGLGLISFLEKSEKTEIWLKYLEFCHHNGKAANPTQKFLKQAEIYIKDLGREYYETLLLDWLDQVAQLKPQYINYYNGYIETYLLTEDNSKTFRALLWTVSLVLQAQFASVLGRLAAKAFTPIPQRGAVSQKIGNTCIQILGELDLAGVSQLAVLRLKIKSSQSLKMINFQIRKIAEAKNMSQSEIEDLAVSDFGLENGKAEMKIGEYKTILRLEGYKPILEYYNSEGKLLKSVPTALKNEYSTELRNWQNKAKELQKVLTAQKHRFDSFYLEQRKWNFAEFRQQYLQHGLFQLIAKKLIWEFEENERKANGIGDEHGFFDQKWEKIEWITDQTTVRLWHPLGADLAEVRQWRENLTEAQIQQPFKQAFREVYLLTEAEMRTNTYSNRFAAHLLKQHQFSVLAKMRGWSYQFLGAYDDGREYTIAHKNFPNWDASVEYWINEVSDFDGEYNDAGIWQYVTTDQVRFKRNGQNMILADIPPLFFSEVLRDIDLFVGVASVGNDPTWNDQGAVARPQSRWTNYWESYSFGELNETAITRKAVLEKLIPKLKIAKKCRLEGKFLIVEGNLRTYKIHLGSSNILMLPNDEYLCIVADRSGKNQDQVFLPFEGDSTLSLILSKAFLLADDHKITDETITRQLEH